MLLGIRQNRWISATPCTSTAPVGRAVPAPPVVRDSVPLLYCHTTHDESGLFGLPLGTPLGS